MTDAPKPSDILVSLQFRFENGAEEFFSARQDRLTVTETADTITIRIEHEDGAIEEATIHRAALIFTKQATQVIRPESTQQDAGRTRITGQVTH